MEPVSDVERQMLRKLCPEFGRNRDPEDEQCVKCDVSEKCETVESTTRKELGMKERPGTQAARMNACLRQGADLDTIATTVGVGRARVRGHILHLRKRGLTVVEENGIWKLEEEEDS